MTEVAEKARMFELDEVSDTLVALVPKHLRAGIDNYVWHGVPPGGFLRAVLVNDLMGAVGRGDSTSLGALQSVCQYVYNAVPSVLHGSDEAVVKHVANARGFYGESP